MKVNLFFSKKDLYIILGIYQKVVIKIDITVARKTPFIPITFPRKTDNIILIIEQNNGANLPCLNKTKVSLYTLQAKAIPLRYNTTINSITVISSSKYSSPIHKTMNGFNNTNIITPAKPYSIQEINKV